MIGPKEWPGARKRERGFVVVPDVAPRINKQEDPVDPAVSNRLAEREVVVINHNGRNVLASTTAALICWKCNQPASLHPIEDDAVSCERELDSFPFTPHGSEDDEWAVPVSDYLLWPNGSVTLPTQQWFDNTDSKFVEPEEYVGHDAIWASIDRLSDKHHTEGTFAVMANGTVKLPQFKFRGSDEYVPGTVPHQRDVNPEMRTAYVEGFDGFFSKKFIDYLVTRKYHAHLVNCYKDKKTGRLRVGSCELAFTPQHVWVRCVKCGLKLKEALDTTEDRMERMVWAIIAHGNNHAARFVREVQEVNPTTGKLEFTGETRPDWYPLDHGVSDKLWLTDQQEFSDQEKVEFLYEHQKFCSEQTCLCTLWIDLLLGKRTKEVESFHNHVKHLKENISVGTAGS